LNYDACVLYPSVVRDVVIRVAIEGTVRAHWSDRILDEVFRNLKKNRPDLDPAKLDRTGVSWRRHLRMPTGPATSRSSTVWCYPTPTIDSCLLRRYALALRSL
jgi:hypothetical protein